MKLYLYVIWGITSLASSAVGSLSCRRDFGTVGGSEDHEVGREVYAEYVFRGKVSALGKYASNGMYSATVRVDELFVKKDNILGIKEKIPVVGFANDNGFELCTGPVVKGQKYIFFVNITLGGHYQTAGIPISFTREMEKAVVLSVCPKCAPRARTKRREVLIEDEADNLEFRVTCKADGIPIPTITWLYNGIPVVKKRGLKLISRTIKSKNRAQKALRFKNLKEPGVYTCIAKNKFGRDEAFTNVKAKQESIYIHCLDQSFCLNGGTCKILATGKLQHCHCQYGTSGIRCQFRDLLRNPFTPAQVDSKASAEKDEDIKTYVVAALAAALALILIMLLVIVLRAGGCQQMGSHSVCCSRHGKPVELSSSSSSHPPPGGGAPVSTSPPLYSLVMVPSPPLGTGTDRQPTTSGYHSCTNGLLDEQSVALRHHVFQLVPCALLEKKVDQPCQMDESLTPECPQDNTVVADFPQNFSKSAHVDNVTNNNNNNNNHVTAAIQRIGKHNKSRASGNFELSSPPSVAPTGRSLSVPDRRALEDRKSRSGSEAKRQSRQRLEVYSGTPGSTLGSDQKNKVNTGSPPDVPAVLDTYSKRPWYSDDGPAPPLSAPGFLSRPFDVYTGMENDREQRGNVLNSSKASSASPAPTQRVGVLSQSASGDTLDSTDGNLNRDASLNDALQQLEALLTPSKGTARRLPGPFPSHLPDDCTVSTSGNLLSCYENDVHPHSSHLFRNPPDKFNDMTRAEVQDTSIRPNIDIHSSSSSKEIGLLGSSRSDSCDTNSDSSSSTARATPSALRHSSGSSSSGGTATTSHTSSNCDYEKDGDVSSLHISESEGIVHSVV